jgi:hypothetical protein
LYITVFDHFVFDASSTFLCHGWKLVAAVAALLNARVTITLCILVLMPCRIPTELLPLFLSPTIFKPQLPPPRTFRIPPAGMGEGVPCISHQYWRGVMYHETGFAAAVDLP